MWPTLMQQIMFRPRGLGEKLQMKINRNIFNSKSTTKREQRKKRVIDQMGWLWKSSLKYLGNAQWGEWVTRSECSLGSLFYDQE